MGNPDRDTKTGGERMITIGNWYIITKGELEEIKARERKLQIRLTDAQIDQFLQGKLHLHANPRKKVAA